jgi:site-specific recombinase XerC
MSLCVALAREVGTLRVFAQYAVREVLACNEAAAGVKAPEAPKSAPPSKAPPKASPGSGQA